MLYTKWEGVEISSAQSEISSSAGRTWDLTAGPIGKPYTCDSIMQELPLHVELTK